MDFETTHPLSIWLGGVINNELILIFLGLILASLLVYLFRSYRAYKRMNDKVRRLRTALLDYYGAKNDQQLAQEVISASTSIDELSEIFGKLGFSKQFNQLKDNLMWFEDERHPRIGVGMVNHLFSSAKLRDEFIALRLDGKAGLFTAIGVLGTFLGLTIGVSHASGGLASPDITVARQAMSDLLRGAELAFITSLAGLIASIIYGQTLARWRDKSVKTLNGLINTLDTVFAPVNAAYAAAQQTVALKQSWDVGIEAMLDHLKSVSSNQANVVSQIQSLRTELPQSLSVSLESQHEVKSSTSSKDDQILAEIN